MNNLPVGLELTEKEEKQRPLQETTTLDIPDGYLSNSRIAVYQSCGEAFRRSYAEGFRYPPSPRMAVGKSVHSLVESSLLYKMANKSLRTLEQALDEASNVTNLEFTDVQASYGDEQSTKAGDWVDRVRKLYQTWHLMRAPHIVPLGVEEKFHTVIRGVPVKGVIDLIDGAGGKVTVVDLKITERRKTDHDLKNSLQLALYANIKGVQDVGFDSIINKVIPEVSLVRACYTKEETAWPEEIVESTAKAISAGVFPLASPDHWRCSQKFCSFWTSCRGKKLP